MSISVGHLTEEELSSQLEQALKTVEVGAIYAHYRDPLKRYRVIGLCIIEATEEPSVIYQKECGTENLKSVVWVRPIHSWLENVSVDGILVPRFRKIQS